jgi:hypothetical protein
VTFDTVDRAQVADTEHRVTEFSVALPERMPLYAGIGQQQPWNINGGIVFVSREKWDRLDGF